MCDKLSLFNDNKTKDLGNKLSRTIARQSKMLSIRSTKI